MCNVGRVEILLHMITQRSKVTEAALVVWDIVEILDF